MEKPDLSQYQALTQAVGFAALERTQLTLTGRDRTSFLHKFCTQDIQSLLPGQGAEAFICNVQGKIVGYVYVLVQEEEIVLDTAAGQAEVLIKHLDRYLIREDVQFADRSGEWSNLLVAGPQASALLERICGSQPPETMLAHHSVTLDAIAVTLCRVPWGGTHSYFLNVPISRLADAITALQRAGATSCEAAAVETLRIECGSPLYGVDVTLENLPQEVARDAQAIHFRKGCYLGQETVARIDALGHVNKLLTGVKFPTATHIERGHEIVLNGKSIGRVTSACWSPALGCPLALAYVRREHQQLATPEAVCMPLPLA